MLAALPDEMFRTLAISSNKMRASSLIMAFTRATNSSLHFLLFFTLPLLSKMLDFPRLKMFHPPETVALEGADDGLADRSSDNFCRGLSKKDAYLYVGPKIDGRESTVFHHFVRQCLLVLHGSQEMLWNKHPCSFPCELLQVRLCSFQ